MNGKHQLKYYYVTRDDQEWLYPESVVRLMRIYRDWHNFNVYINNRYFSKLKDFAFWEWGIPVEPHIKVEVYSMDTTSAPDSNKFKTFDELRMAYDTLRFVSEIEMNKLRKKIFELETALKEYQKERVHES